jgi:hypothetical protein
MKSKSANPKTVQYRKYYENNKDKVNAQKKIYREAHPSVTEKIIFNKKEYYWKNRERIREVEKAYYHKNHERIRLRDKKYRDLCKSKVLDYYGNKCACCGETISKFLTLDHINNDGAEHRRELKIKGSSQSIYLWIIKHNYPDRFQILCFNCNIGKNLNGGICPHKRLANKLTKSVVACAL